MFQSMFVCTKCIMIAVISLLLNGLPHLLSKVLFSLQFVDAGLDHVGKLGVIETAGTELHLVQGAVTVGVQGFEN